MKITVAVVKNDLSKIARKLPGAVGGIIQETLEEMHAYTVAQMQASSPPPSAPGQAPAIDTGRLVGSLRIEMEGETTGVFLTEDVPYAIYLEYGTSRMAPRPFMAPAAAEGARVLGEKAKELEDRLT